MLSWTILIYLPVARSLVTKAETVVNSSSQSIVAISGVIRYTILHVAGDWLVRLMRSDL
jgi:hypothetical protein